MSKWEIIQTLLTLVVLIVAVICFALDIFEDKTSKKTYILIAITVLSIIFIFYGEYKKDSQEWVIDKKPYNVEKIVSLNDNNMVEGKITGGRYAIRGYIGETLYYQYMVQLNNGGYVANKVKANETILYYSKDNYRVEWYKKKKKWLYFEEEEIYHKIFIPEDSIADEYSIDLE